MDLWQILGNLLGNLLSIRGLGETEDESRGIPRIPRAPGFSPHRGNVLNKADTGCQVAIVSAQRKEFHRVSYSTLQSLGCLTDS